MLRFVFFVIFILNSAVGAAAPTCGNIFRTSVQKLSLAEINEQVMSIDSLRLKSAVHAIFDKDSLSSSEKLAQAFKVYLSLRLEKLPVEIHDSVRVGVKSMTLETSWKTNAHFSHLHKTITLFLPDSLRNSVIDYTIRVHELEHLIQEAQAVEKQVEIRTKYLERLKAPIKAPIQEIFTIEHGAMYAEGLFLLSVPYSEVRRALKSLGKDPVVQAYSEEFVSAKDAHQYVQKQWASNRYSIESFYQQAYFEKLILAMPIAVGLGAVVGAVYYLQSQDNQ